MTSPITLAILGIGRWGTNYFRTLTRMGGAKVNWLCATREESFGRALEAVKPKEKPGFSTDHLEPLADPAVDAVIVATPGSTHPGMAKAALEAGKHVLVEKPVAFRVEQVEGLVGLARQRGLVFMAGHIHLFNPAISRLKEDVRGGRFGEIRYIQSYGSGNGPVRTDMGALWDYLPHDVSIILHLLEEMPSRVSAHGAAYRNEGFEDVVSAQFAFPSGTAATLFGSWMHPLKRRGLVLAGEKGYAVWDDYAPKERLCYYAPDCSPRDQDYDVIDVQGEMPLTAEVEHFLRSIRERSEPLTGGEHALKVTRVLEACALSLQQEGIPVDLG